MTTVAVLADPPQHASSLDGLVETGVLDADEAATLYTAALCDACVAVERSGGDLLVNYRVPDAVDSAGDRSDSDGDGDGGGGDGDGDGNRVGDGDGSSDGGAEAAAREAVVDALSLAFEDATQLRYEVQVGSDRSSRVGNTVTHLLEREGVQSAAVLDPTVALLERRHVDEAAMKLRQSEVVLGPAPAGQVWYAAFTEPVDFSEVFAPPALETLTERARSDGLDVDFLEALPVVDGRAGLASALVHLRARERADRPVPSYTSAAFDQLDVDVVASADGLTVERD